MTTKTGEAKAITQSFLDEFDVRLCTAADVAGAIRHLSTLPEEASGSVAAVAAMLCDELVSLSEAFESISRGFESSRVHRLGV